MKMKKIYSGLVLLSLVFLAAAPSATAAETSRLTDVKIADAVERNLILSAQVPQHLIDIHVNDGIVTLSGTVNNILARDWAVERSQSVRGVRSVIDRIKVNPVDRKDREIRVDIDRALLYDPATDASEIDVKVKDGVASLEGVADSYAERNLVVQVAKGVKGVREVENNIDVNFKESRTDGEIKAEVERSLASDPYVNDFLIDVEVNDGTVKLTGTVETAAAVTYTVLHGWVAGVKEVDNSELLVKPSLKPEMKRTRKILDKSDPAIKKSVEDAFLYDPRVLSFNINTNVEEGTVYLTGKVDNLKAKRSAEDDARNTAGVRSVVNDIQVRSSDFPSDETVERRVRMALFWDPIVERHDLTPVVRNNKVYLYGAVDSTYEKWHAEDVASRVFGVADVQNSIQVLGEWKWKSDADILADIKGELFWSPYVDSGEVSVSVEDGRAILTGAVSDWPEYSAVVENAWEGGARVVETRLDISGDSTTAPDQVIYQTPYISWWDYGSL